MPTLTAAEVWVGAGLPAMQAVTVWTPSWASPLLQAACAAMPTLTVAEVWVGAGLPAMQAVTIRTPSRASPLPQAACAAMPILTAAEVWVGAGLPAIGPCQASHAIGHVRSRKDSRSHTGLASICQANHAARPVRRRLRSTDPVHRRYDDQYGEADDRPRIDTGSRLAHLGRVSHGIASCDGMNAHLWELSSTMPTSQAGSLR